MADYEGTFTTSAIQVKDPEKFEKTIRALRFKRENEQGYSGLWFDTFEQDGVTYFGLFSYEGTPGYLGECMFDQKCDECPLKKMCTDEETGKCIFKENEDGDVSGEDMDYDLSYIISEHIEPGTKAILIEAGHEKLRYVSAIRSEITSEGVTCTDMGTSWNEIVK